MTRILTLRLYLKTSRLIVAVGCLRALSPWLGVSPALASAPKSIGKFQNWSAYVAGENEQRICFVVSKPRYKVPRKAKRGDIFMSITHRPAEKLRYEASIRVGYSFSKQSKPKADIDGSSYRFFSGTQVANGAPEWAWLVDLDKTQDLVTNMKKSNRLVFHGLSSRGTTTRDTYSLIGFSKAIKAIDKACPQ